MADALVSVLLEQLASITLPQAEQQVKLVVGVKKEVGKLTSNLETIQAVLEDAERRQVKEATVKQWLAKLKDVCYDMEDVLDEWNIALLKMQMEGDENAPQPKGKVGSFIPSFCFCFRKVAQRHGIAIKIKDLNDKLDVIVNEKRNFDFTLIRGTEKHERQMTASVDVSRMTTSFVDVSEVHGRDQDKTTLVGMLLSESSQGPTLRIISIAGMGGLGKTTLAQLVCKDDKVKAHFQEIIWVCVSDPFNEIRIAKAVLESLKVKAHDLNELNSLWERIHGSLKGKKFLLVLDDVWTEDYIRLEQLKNSLKCGSPGSRILVTTRKEIVAKNIGTTDMFQLGQLSDEECWSLFSQVAFFGWSSKESEKLEDIGRKIVDKCKGLPLAAKILGSLLRLKNTRKEWQSVLNSEVWKLKAEKGIFPPLLLSYYDLSSTMRRCFSYCAIFPKDYKMKKDRLIKLWMAQGYLGTSSNDMEMIGEECFKNLAMLSFFQNIENDENNGTITCQMHDIVHDLAQFLTENEFFVVEANDSEESMLSHVEARHLMWLPRSDSILPSTKNIKNLRSLITEETSLPAAIAVSPKVFNQLTHLRALDWCSSKSTIEVLKEIGKLIHLRYLNLSYSVNLQELPEIVCDLCNLQSLNVSYCSSLKKLPHGLGKLINLRHLEISSTGLSFMPKGIERLTCLRTLDTFYISSSVNDSEASTLEDLKNLNHLGGILEMRWLGKVRDVDEVKNAQLKNKEDLLRLTLNFYGEEAEGRMINDEQVFEAIQPPPNLEQLIIYGYRGTDMFLNWMMSLTNLKKVEIQECKNCEFLPPLGKLSSLESLEIWFMTGVKRVGIEFLGIESEVNKNDKNEGPSKKDVPNTSSSSSVIAFPKLEELTFWVMYGWEEWDYGMSRRMGEEEDDITTATTNIIIMPRLQFLWIAHCPELKALPDHLPHTTSSLKQLRIYNCPKLKALPDHLLHTTSSLKQLRIYDCPILEERYYKQGRKGEDWPKISHIPDIRIDGPCVQIDGMEPRDESSSDSE